MYSHFSRFSRSSGNPGGYFVFWDLYHTFVTGWCLSTMTVDMGGASVPLALLRAPLPAARVRPSSDLRLQHLGRFSFHGSL